MHTFATLVNTRRTERQMSLWDVALASGVSYQVISNMEHGKGCTLKKAEAVARALGINAIPVDPA